MSKFSGSLIYDQQRSTQVRGTSTCRVDRATCLVPACRAVPTSLDSRRTATSQPAAGWPLAAVTSRRASLFRAPGAEPAHGAHGVSPAVPTCGSHDCFLRGTRASMAETADKGLGAYMDRAHLALCPATMVPSKGCDLTHTHRCFQSTRDRLGHHERWSQYRGADCSLYL